VAAKAAYRAVRKFLPKLEVHRGKSEKGLP
jgi:hypothetical protein